MTSDTLHDLNRIEENFLLYQLNYLAQDAYEKLLADEYAPRDLKKLSLLIQSKIHFSFLFNE
jgi:hypothetical protein